MSFDQSAYGVDEADDPNTADTTENEVTVTLTLDVDPERTVSIPLSRDNQGGASDADYSGVPASLAFNSGETSKTFTFTATDDSVVDEGESVKLAFGSLPAGVTPGSTSETTISIADNDVPGVTVSFGAATYTANEGGTATVEVTLDTAPGREVVIPLSATNQGGAVDEDYSGVPASVTFSATQTSRTFTFTAIDDAVDDDGESVKLGFGTLPDKVTAGTPSETTVSITDNDVPDVTVSFAAAAYTAAEGGSATITVSLDRPRSGR